MPQIFGGAFHLTVIENGASERVATPSETRMVMFEKVRPAWVEVGVPASLPVFELNHIQAGLPEIENLSGSPFASYADGLNA